MPTYTATGMRSPFLTVKRASRLLASGLVTSEQLCAFCHALAIAGEEQWQLNAFTRLIPIQVLLDNARASDERRRQNNGNMSPLEGLPVSIKANIAVSNQPLTAASGVLSDETPCGYDADAVSKLVKSGAIILGITNMDEFGMGSLGTHAAPSKASGETVTRNPSQYIRHLNEILSLGDSNDSSMAKLIQMSSDHIMDVHADAFSSVRENTIHSAGGSSCGSAASVAHGSSVASLGTDTGGSVRLPSAWCGVVGLKPSYGLISRHGVVSYASSLDTVGILAPTVDCASTVLDCLAQRESVHGSRDSTASFYDASVSLSSLENKGKQSELLSGIKIGIPSAFSVADCPFAIRDAWNSGAHCLRDHGASIELISTELLSPELIRKSLAAYYVLASAEASSNLSRYDGIRYGPSASIDNENYQADSDMTPLEVLYSTTRSQGFGSEVVRRILSGTSVLSSDRFHTHYEAAAKLRAALTQQFHEVLTKVDVLLLPTVLSSSCNLDEMPDSTEMFANDVMTVPISLAGLPAVSVPVPLTSGEKNHGADASVGLQIVGSRLNEKTILEVARVIEEAGNVTSFNNTR